MIRNMSVAVQEVPSRRGTDTRKRRYKSELWMISYCIMVSIKSTSLGYFRNSGFEYW